MAPWPCRSRTGREPFPVDWTRTGAWRCSVAYRFHPLADTPSAFVAAHEASTTVPFGRHRTPVRAAQRVEVYVVGRIQPLRFAVRARNPNEGATPVILPPCPLLPTEPVCRYLLSPLELSHGYHIASRINREDVVARLRQIWGRSQMDNGIAFTPTLWVRLPPPPFLASSYFQHCNVGVNSTPTDCQLS